MKLGDCTTTVVDGVGEGVGLGSGSLVSGVGVAEGSVDAVGSTGVCVVSVRSGVSGPDGSVGVGLTDSTVSAVGSASASVPDADVDTHMMQGAVTVTVSIVISRFAGVGRTTTAASRVCRRQVAVMAARQIFILTLDLLPHFCYSYLSGCTVDWSRDELSV